jgi:hypothetical protein
LLLLQPLLPHLCPQLQCHPQHLLLLLLVQQELLQQQHHLLLQLRLLLSGWVA